jgi:hypothetical protein
MITGSHSIIYSRKPEEDRRFLRDVLKFPNVDVGEGWLIFGLPPSGVYQPRYARPAAMPARQGARRKPAAKKAARKR